MNLWDAKQVAFDMAVRQLTVQGWTGIVSDILTVSTISPEVSDWYCQSTENVQINFASFLGKMREACYANLDASKMSTPDTLCVHFYDMCDAPRSRLKWPSEFESEAKAASRREVERLCGFASEPIVIPADVLREQVQMQIKQLAQDLLADVLVETNGNEMFFSTSSGPLDAESFIDVLNETYPEHYKWAEVEVKHSV